MQSSIEQNGIKLWLRDVSGWGIWENCGNSGLPKEKRYTKELGS